MVDDHPNSFLAISDVADHYTVIVVYVQTHSDDGGGWIKWYNNGTIWSNNEGVCNMLKISRLADYATVLMSVLAATQSSMASGELANKTQIKRPTVRKVMKLLNEAGLVQSSQGAMGGYCLVDVPENISVVSIVSAIDGSPAITECAKADVQCEQVNTCGLRGNWQRINQLVVNVLSNVSLADMMKPTEQPLVFFKRKEEQ